MKNPIKLPSAFQPEDYCYLILANGSGVRSKVTAVKFTSSKVLYDLDVDLDLGTKSSRTTRLHGVDSAFVEKMPSIESRQKISVS